MYLKRWSSLARSASSDCGVFAVAFAVSLCYGLQPAKFCYNQNNISFIAWKEVEWNFSPLDESEEKIPLFFILKVSKYTVYAECLKLERKE